MCVPRGGHTQAGAGLSPSADGHLDDRVGDRCCRPKHRPLCLACPRQPGHAHPPSPALPALGWGGVGRWSWRRLCRGAAFNFPRRYCSPQWVCCLPWSPTICSPVFSHIYRSPSLTTSLLPLSILLLFITWEGRLWKWQIRAAAGEAVWQGRKGPSAAALRLLVGTTALSWSRSLRLAAPGVGGAR